MRRRAVEPVIGRLKNEHRIERNDLHRRHGDANNAILAAVGVLPRPLLRSWPAKIGHSVKDDSSPMTRLSPLPNPIEGAPHGAPRR
jgi:hypothetical protein